MRNDSSNSNGRRVDFNTKGIIFDFNCGHTILDSLVSKLFLEFDSQQTISEFGGEQKKFRNRW